MEQNTKHEMAIQAAGQAAGKSSDPKSDCAKIHERVDMILENRANGRPHSLDHCEDDAGSCPCSTSVGGRTPVVDLVIMIDTSGSMTDNGEAISRVAERAVEAAQQKCPTDLRVSWFGVGSTFGGTKFDKTHRDYIASLGLTPAPVFNADATPSGSHAVREEGADAVADIATYFDWRENACRAVFYISDESLDLGDPHNAADDAATANAITVANNNSVTVFTHLVNGAVASTNPPDIANYTDLAEKTGGKAQIGGEGDEDQYIDLLQDVICNACGGCQEAAIPDLHPCISIHWGDSNCDELETDDYEVLSISVCNCYSNITFTDFEIGFIKVLDEDGNSVPNLPDGSPSVEAVPAGPFCFGDIAPCVDGETSCVTREFVLSSRGAKKGKYRLSLAGVCYGITTQHLVSSCFEFELCPS